MSFFSPKFDPRSLKSNLNLCKARLDLLQKKKTEQGMKGRREIAELIKQGKIERSRIKCEQIVREDYVVEGMESLKTYCEVLVSRFAILESKAEVDPTLETAITTLIWSSRHGAEVPELNMITELFQRKYTKAYVQSCLENRLKKADQSVMKKLSLQVPPPQLVEQYMTEIAKSYGVVYEPNIDFLNRDESDINENDGLISLDMITPGAPVPLPEGHNMIPPKWDHGEVSGGLPYPTTSPFPSADPAPPMPLQPPVVNNTPDFSAGSDNAPPSYMDSMSHEKDNDRTSLNLPSVPGSASENRAAGQKNDPDDEFDSLTKRFNQLLNKDDKPNPPR